MSEDSLNNTFDSLSLAPQPEPMEVPCSDMPQNQLLLNDLELFPDQQEGPSRKKVVNQKKANPPRRKSQDLPLLEILSTKPGNDESSEAKMLSLTPNIKSAKQQYSQSTIKSAHLSASRGIPTPKLLSRTSPGPNEVEEANESYHIARPRFTKIQTPIDVQQRCQSSAPQEEEKEPQDSHLSTMFNKFAWRSKSPLCAASSSFKSDKPRERAFQQSSPLQEAIRQPRNGPREQVPDPYIAESPKFPLHKVLIKRQDSGRIEEERPSIKMLSQIPDSQDTTYTEQSPASLTQTSGLVPEENVLPTLQNSQRKRKQTDSLVVAELKKIKRTVDSLKDSEMTNLKFKTQRKYTTETKRNAIKLSQKFGPCKVSALTGIPESSLRRWEKVGPNRLGNSGRKPAYPNIEAKLLEEFKELRKKGIAVTNISLLQMARDIARREEDKKFVGTIGWVRGFRNRNGIVYRRKTRASQKIPKDSVKHVQDFQRDFIDLISLHNYASEAIVNVDEVGVTYDMPSSFTLEIQGKKEILISTCSAEKQRITFLLGVNGENDMLPMFTIFKGKAIPKNMRSFDDPDFTLTANSSAWMTVDIFMDWIERVWKPYATQFPRTLLIMDHFRVHLNPEVITLLNSYKTDVLFIPKGLTWFIQPCDIYLNGPLKSKLRTRWTQHMSAQTESEGKFKKLGNEDLLMMVKECLLSIELRENVFYDTIFRDPSELLEKPTVQEDLEDEEELVLDEEDELFFEAEQDFIDL